MACSWNEQLCLELGEKLGIEAAYQGASMILGPGLNVKRSPLCGRNFEYFSEDGYLSGKIAAAYVRGIQANGVTACIKHFAVNSRELGRMVYDCVLDEQTLRETYLTGFEIAVKEGKAGAVMTAYNKVNGVYCNQNDYLIRGILRGEWGFDGLVVSDWGGGRDSVAAVRAGADLEMPQCKFSVPPIVTAVKQGELSEHFVDESVGRLYRFVDRSKNIERVAFDEKSHSDFAKRCAEESLVLLKNDNDALPLKEGERVALIGDFAVTPRYQGAGSSLVNPTSLDNIAGAMGKSCLNLVGVARGFKRFGKASKSLTRRALALANKADTVVLCLGLDEDSEAEGSDRQNILLPQNQIELLKSLKNTCKKIIVVLSCGSVVDMSWDELCDGVLHAHLSGQSGAGAVVDALTGAVNPSGRLAETYPLKLADVACADIYSADPYKMTFAEGVYVGYKYYDALGLPVKYPFGYGLSYTTFKCSDAEINADGVTFTLTNTGKRDGAFVAQVYVKAERGCLKSSFKELKGFKKVFLKVGASERVYIPFDEYTFRVWNKERARWEVGSRYEIFLGENSRDVLFSQKLQIEKGCVRHFGDYCFAEDDKIEDDKIDDKMKESLSYADYYAQNLETGSHGEKETTERIKGVVADYSTIIADLKYCKGIMGKVFGFIAFHYSTAKDKIIANSMSYLPLRSLMQFMRLDSVQAEGMIEACNGKFFHGLKKIIFKK
jgi:beta-glucosidase